MVKRDLMAKNAEGLTSITQQATRTVTYKMAMDILETEKNDPAKLTAEDDIWLTFYSTQVDVKKDTNTQIMSLILDFDPTELKVQDWIDDTRNLCDELEEKGGLHVKFLLHNSIVTDYDTMKQTYDELPAMIGVAVCLAFFMMAVLMGSAFSIIRLFFVVALPLCAVLGVGVLVYQDGWLAWTDYSRLQETGAFYWSVPIVCFSAGLGLALDYDVFITARIKEFRSMGFNMQEAIARAMASNSNIICCAGLIMACALGSNLLSSNPSLSQIGFLMGLSVLVDTFLITTLLVPATMSYLDRIVWWPTRMPDPNSQGELSDGSDNDSNNSEPYPYDEPYPDAEKDSNNSDPRWYSRFLDACFFCVHDPKKQGNSEADNNIAPEESEDEDELDVLPVTSKLLNKTKSNKQKQVGFRDVEMGKRQGSQHREKVLLSVVSPGGLDSEEPHRSQLISPMLPEPVLPIQVLPVRRKSTERNNQVPYDLPESPPANETGISGASQKP